MYQKDNFICLENILLIKKNYDVKIIDIYNKYIQNSLVLIRKIF